MTEHKSQTIADRSKPCKPARVTEQQVVDFVWRNSPGVDRSDYGTVLKKAERIHTLGHLNKRTIDFELLQRIAAENGNELPFYR